MTDVQAEPPSGATPATATPGPTPAVTAGAANGQEPLPPAVFATMLATEHWSLLGTRSTMWTEIMSRITIHLTVSSAALVVLALFAQATGFGAAFHIMSIGLASAVLVLGSLTAMRVVMASHEDAALILGMNRIRAAYVRLEPRMADHLTTSVYDDERGLNATYTMGSPRKSVVHVVGSTGFFILTVNAIVSGTLGALATEAAGGSTVAVSVVGVVAGLLYLGAALAIVTRQFAVGQFGTRFPSPADPEAPTATKVSWPRGQTRGRPRAR